MENQEFNLNVRHGLPMYYMSKKTGSLQKEITMATDKVVNVGDTIFFGFDNKSLHVKHEVVEVKESRRAAGVWDIERPNFFRINVNQIITV